MNEEFKDTGAPPEAELVQTVAQVSHLLRTLPDAAAVAEQLQWTPEALTKFREDHAALLEYADQVAASPIPAVPPTSMEIELPPDGSDLPKGPLTQEDMAAIVARTDRNLAEGLKSIGLTEAEAAEGQALQAYNQNYFKDSMDIVSSNSLRTLLKLAVQQREIEGRLAFVRQQINLYGEYASDERSGWVKEENLLMRQYLDLAAMAEKFHQGWHKGAAMLAVIRMRMRDLPPAGGRTQRKGKPGFRPAGSADNHE